jgi:neutral ceramidase
VDDIIISRRRFLQATTAAGAWTLVPPVARMASALTTHDPSPLRAGVGVADLTPELGGTFFGYVRPDRTANGVAVRLFARAVVLDDGATRLAIVTVDLGASLDKSSVVSRLADLGYGMEDVVIAPTHTHAGPEEWTDWLIDQIALAVRRANRALGPARAAWARGRVDGVNTNRSVEAHLANHGLEVPVREGDPSMDPEGVDHPRDLLLRLLRVERPSGEPLVGWGTFAVHPTNFPNTNTLLSADLSGLAARHFEQSFDPRAGRVTVGGTGAPIGVLANSNEGDLISLYESHNPHSCTDLMGRRLARRMRELWDDAGSRLTRRVPVGVRWTRIRYRGQEVEEGRPVANRGVFGLPFLGGAENGPSPFHGNTEGQRRPRAAADPVHGRKIIASPAPWRTDPELQVLRIGDTLLVAVPGEATVEAGRRITASALAAAPEGVDDAAILGLTNDYVGYFTTPEEYDEQHYEGGHTVFGKWSTLLVIEGGRELTEAIASGQPAPPPDEDPNRFPYPPPGGSGGAVGGGAGQGTIRTQPACSVPRMELVEVTWDGGPDGHDRPVDTPFVLLERRGPDQSWRAVDSDLGDAFTWTEEDGTYWARHDVAPDLPLGTYRLHITAARYAIASEPFQVTASRALIIRGVEGEPADGATRLVFRAQHPPPAPDRHLRYREPPPAGGVLRFRHGGTEHEARWDAISEGWLATVTGTVTTVEVPDGALVDGNGNTSGAGGTFAVGDVAELDWPPDMEVGGTGRDWHAHGPAHADDGRDRPCPAPGVEREDHAASAGGGSGSGDGGRSGGTQDGADGTSRATPATGGGAAVGGVLTLAAAAAAHRSASRAGAERAGRAAEPT